jgi:exopolysaccharide production protein ExoY
MEAVTRQTIERTRSVDARARVVAPSRVFVAVKRAMDIVGSLLLLVVSAPVLLVLGLAALVTSGRPVLYRQQRVGRGGREFEILKLRSMNTNADHHLRVVPELESAYLAGGYKLPSEDDPRITRLGRFMRRFDLDELPQIWNVLRGDMSLIGPRPVPERELLLYGPDRVFYESVRPGITGLWQVSGRNEVSYPERVALDVEYVERLSIRSDIRILLRTPATVFRPTKVPAKA